MYQVKNLKNTIFFDVTRVKLIYRTNIKHIKPFSSKDLIIRTAKYSFKHLKMNNPTLPDDYPEEYLDNPIRLMKNHEKRILRTLDGKLRGFLSDRYRRLDNLELVDHVLPALAQMKDCEIASCDITETNLYIKVINKAMEVSCCLKQHK